jgi:hypothetical protein
MVGAKHSVLNMGLWDGDIDYNAVDKVPYCFDRTPILDALPEGYDGTTNLRSRGCFLPICAMNVAVKREAAPLLYQIPWDTNRTDPTLVFKRMDDIWAGVIFCSVARLLDWPISFGAPLVHHQKVDLDLLRHAHYENLGNALIWRLQQAIMNATHAIHGSSDPLTVAMSLLRGVRPANSLMESILNETRAKYERWTRLIRSVM